MIILIVFDIATITKLYLYRKVNIYLQIRLKCEVSKWVINTNKQFKKVQNLDCILNYSKSYAKRPVSQSECDDDVVMSHPHNK